VGNYSWGGAANTYFLIDPSEGMIVIHMTQLMYNDPMKLPLRAQLGSLVYGAVVDPAPYPRMMRSKL